MASEVAKLAKLIVDTHDGQVSFNMAEAAAILGYKNANRIGSVLNEHGITVRKSGEKGNGKNVTAYDLAVIMCRDKVSPLRGRKGA